MKSGHRPYCKPCRKDLAAKEYRADPAKFMARSVKSRAKDPEGEYLRHVKRRYGLSKEAYNALYVSQEGVCAICKRNTKLIVDHCHITGIVRGLLCSSCNTAIGLLGDSSELLIVATGYIRKREYVKL